MLAKFQRLLAGGRGRIAFDDFRLAARFIQKCLGFEGFCLLKTAFPPPKQDKTNRCAGGKQSGAFENIRQQNHFRTARGYG